MLWVHGRELHTGTEAYVQKRDVGSLWVNIALLYRLNAKGLCAQRPETHLYIFSLALLLNPIWVPNFTIP